MAWNKFNRLKNNTMRHSSGRIFFTLSTIFLSTSVFGNHANADSALEYELETSAGGVIQLTYQIDLSEVEEKNADEDPENDVVIEEIIGDIRDKIELRVRALEATDYYVYTEEKEGQNHVAVELEGVKDVEEAKRMIKREILLEFKEPGTGEDNEQLAAIQTEADLTLQKALNEPENFGTIAETSVTADDRVAFEPNQAGFASELSGNLAAIGELEVGEIYPELAEESGNFTVTPDGQISQREGFLIIQLDGKETRENTIQIQEQVEASHILITYEGADGATEEITRSKAEALAEAERILVDARNDPASFNALAVEFSDDPTGQSNGGDLGFFTRGMMVEEFETAAFSLEIGQISEVVESPFGFHIIKVTDRIDASETIEEEFYVTYSQIFYDTTLSPWSKTGLDGSMLESATTGLDPYMGTPIIKLQFNEEGAILLEELTESLIGSQLGIFVGGEFISAPAINEKISGGSASISGGNPPFTSQNATDLAFDLNQGTFAAPIALIDEKNIPSLSGSNKDFEPNLHQIILVLNQFRLILAY